MPADTGWIGVPQRLEWTPDPVSPGGGNYVATSLGSTFSDPLLQLLESNPEAQRDLLEFRHTLEASCAFYAASRATEMYRVLKPGGQLGLIWNLRDATVPWVAQLDAIGMIKGGASAISILVTTLLLTSQHLLYAMHLRPPCCSSAAPQKALRRISRDV